jgi:uncharacterized membrane protein
MLSQRRVRLVIAVAIVIAVAGLIDAALGAIWDQFAVLAVVVVLLASALLMTRSDRVEVLIRADLARWLRNRSAVEGESVELVADRMLATARDHLCPDPGTAEQSGGAGGDSGVTP